MTTNNGTQDTPDEEPEESLEERLDTLEVACYQLTGQVRALRSVCEALIAYAPFPVQKLLSRHLKEFARHRSRESSLGPPDARLLEMTLTGRERIQRTSTAYGEVSGYMEIAQGMPTFKEMLEDMMELVLELEQPEAGTD